MRLTLLDAQVPAPLEVGSTHSTEDLPARAVLATQKPVIVHVDDDSPYDCLEVPRGGRTKTFFTSTLGMYAADSGDGWLDDELADEELVDVRRVEEGALATARVLLKVSDAPTLRHHR
jgi:hypothetical protein